MKANIELITFENDQYQVVVVFGDDNFNARKTYYFDRDITQAQAVKQIKDDGQAYKDDLAKLTALQSKVGTVINI